ncbi:hypothetical protein L596_021011 [Steinernema carpocapsae]|uniref:Uncharacterized protein n=1 Tax=Steinernema carpocapsae TaxID=34508 RepID=A0A4U5MVX6_STECR|nr:hypothetical protein L596_021011 [Steinernema carpocapsae]
MHTLLISVFVVMLIALAAAFEPYSYLKEEPVVYSRQIRNAFVQRLFNTKKNAEVFVQMLRKGKGTRDLKPTRSRFVKSRKQGPFRSLFNFTY